MNVLLFRTEELDTNQHLQVTDRRLQHLRKVLRSQVGDSIRVGMIEGKLGHARIVEINDAHAWLKVALENQPPAPLPLTVVLALPRPKMLRRILRGLCEVGVKDIHLINSYRVEKSYWQSPLLSVNNTERALLDGLEQSIDTRLPRVSLAKRFRPFAEDVLPELVQGRYAYLADHRSESPYPSAPPDPALVIVGPEGGFIPFELELLRSAGARSASLGPRVLRVETALQCIVGRHLAH